MDDAANTSANCSSPSTQIPPRPRRAILAAALIATLTVLAYWSALGGGFILDDDVYLTYSPIIQSPYGLRDFWFSTRAIDYYPVSNSSLWFEWRLWGTNAAGYRFTNVAIHILCSLLIWAVARKLALPGAYLAAMLFALHPVNVESIAWIAQRKGLLAMLFALLSVLCYLHYLPSRQASLSSEPATDIRPTHRNSWYTASLLCFLLAMLSKGSVALVPLVLVLILWWRQKRLVRGDVLRLCPFIVVAVLLSVVHTWTQVKYDPIRSAGLIDRVAEAGATPWFYWSKALLPLDLLFVYPQWQIDSRHLLWWCPLFAAVVALALLWRNRNNDICRALFATAVFFCLALAPVMGLIDVGFMRFSLVADHYQYHALAGLVMFVAATLSYFHRSPVLLLRSATAVASVAVLACLLLLTWQQSALYSDPIVLYRVTLQRNPRAWVLENNLGNTLVAAGDVPGGIAHLERALKLKPDYVDAMEGLAIGLGRLRRFDDAIASLQKALAIKLDDVRALNNYGELLLNMGRPHDAIRKFEEALRIDPESTSALVNLGVALDRTGKSQQAVAVYIHALDATSDAGMRAIIYSNLAQAYAAAGQIGAAIGAAEEAIDLARSQGNQPLVEKMQSWLNSRF